ncbi:sigma factor-like helix-turn-helix DNA-binding protein [Roseobacter sp. HKCC-CH-9208]|uniref:sigma factor-like helix-turn-helix DNA-binding protein n=1 Tax=Roseobacter sp. HKCC-CH-9208 TaxID=3120339 RepID=UPI0030ECC404
MRILTERQREALELVIKGRTMRKIAFAMEINVTTVEKHLRGARDILQADTTAQAAAKTLILNQIFL